MATELFLDGVDAATHYGFRIESSPGTRDLPAARLDTLTVPGQAGAVLLTDPIIEPRTLTLRGTLRAITAAALRTRRDALFATLRRATVTLRQAEDPTRELTVRVTGCTIPVSAAQAIARAWPIELACTALDPYWSDVTPLAIAVAQTPVPMPCGTAPSAPVIVITNPGRVVTVTLRNVLGEVVTSLQLAGLSPSVPVRIDCGARLIRQGTANAIDALVAGDFPVLDVVADGDLAAEAWPTLTVSQGSALVTYARRWA